MPPEAVKSVCERTPACSMRRCETAHRRKPSRTRIRCRVPGGNDGRNYRRASSQLRTRDTNAPGPGGGCSWDTTSSKGRPGRPLPGADRPSDCARTAGPRRPCPPLHRRGPRAAAQHQLRAAPADRRGLVGSLRPCGGATSVIWSSRCTDSSLEPWTSLGRNTWSSSPTPSVARHCSSKGGSRNQSVRRGRCNSAPGQSAT
jgi:hypothetical protein